MNPFPKRNAQTSSSVNHKKHPFYLDQQNNSRVPKWFIECSRQDAESLLTVRQDDGNVLMRPSQQNPYALSIRTVVNGVGKFNHYAVQRNSRGEFFMDIDNPHSPVPSLSQVIELFIQLAGQSNHRALGTSRTAALPKLSPTLSNPPGGILQGQTDNSRLLSAPVAPLQKPLSHRGSVNAYIDRPRTDVHRSVERVASRPDYLHIQSTDETSDYLHPAAADDVHNATDDYDAGHYLMLADEVLTNSQLSTASTKSDYLTVTDDIDSTTTTPFADNCEQQTITTPPPQQQRQQQQASGYLTLTDETDDQQTNNNIVYDKPRTNYSQVKNPVASNYINLDAKVQPLCSESNCRTQSTSLSKCGVGSSFNSNVAYESPRSTKPDYINLSAAVGVSQEMNGHKLPVQPRKPKPAAVAPDYLKAYVPEDSDLPDADAPPPPSTANHVKSRRSPPAVPGNGLKGLGSPVSSARSGPGSGVRGPAGPVCSSARGGPLSPLGGRGDPVFRPIGSGIRGPGVYLTPAGGRGGPANPAGNLSKLAVCGDQ